MEHAPYLYDTLVQVLRQHRNWLDLRHLKTLAWMMVGLIHSGSISLGAWTPFVISRAQYSQSTVRRFRRWLDNDKIEVHALYGRLMKQALMGWVDQTLYVALDTSMLWDTYCIIRLSVIYRGRAVPRVWSGIEHGSATVAYEVYTALLDKAATLLPFSCRVVFLAGNRSGWSIWECVRLRLGPIEHPWPLAARREPVHHAPQPDTPR